MFRNFGLFLTETVGGDADGITSALTTALGSVKDDALDVIGTVLPYALAIVGAVLVVTIGIKVFKRISGK